MKRKCDDNGILIELKKIPIKEIVYKEARAVAHEERARKYAEQLKQGRIFKPINVFGKRFKGDTYQVFDGHARVLAYKMAGRKMIDAEITLVDKNGKSLRCKP